LKDNECLYIGDDVVDIPVLRRAGMAVTVADAPEYMDEYCDFRTSTKAVKRCERSDRNAFKGKRPMGRFDAKIYLIILVLSGISLFFYNAVAETGKHLLFYMISSCPNTIRIQEIWIVLFMGRKPRPWMSGSILISSRLNG